MFSELPRLFDRNFVIGYFLPVTLFVAASTVLWGYGPTIQAVLTGQTSFDAALIVFDATLVILLAWIVAVLLMVLNREVYRLLEGYWQYNPLQLFEGRMKRSFENKHDRLDWLEKEYSKRNSAEELLKERSKIMKDLAEGYPDQQSLILPTSFGNTLRAFEIYPRVMYGIEGIDGWPRILAVIPKEYRELIDDAKAQVDWWVNLGIMSCLFLIEFWIMILFKQGLHSPWLYTVLNTLIPLAGFVVLNLFFRWRATSAAIGWGDYVKSAFDLYRFKLIEALGIELPKDREEEKDLWIKYSQAIIYRLPDRLPGLKKDPYETTTKKIDSKEKDRKN